MATRTADQLGIDAVEVEEMLSRNMTFPARWYSDSLIYEFGPERILTWVRQLAGPLHELARPGCNAAHGVQPDPDPLEDDA